MRRFSTALVIVMLLSSCFKDGVLNLTNGLVFNINAKLLSTPIAVSFVNSVPNSDDFPNGLHLEFFGEGANKLFTPTGSANLVVVDGLVYIGVNDGVVATADNPLEFGMRVSADGFYPATYMASLHHRDISQHISVYMVEAGNTPQGVSDKNEIRQVNGSGFESAQSFETPLNGGKEESVRIQFAPGAQLFTSDNALVTGNVEIDLVHYDNRSPMSLRAIAGITESIPASALNGEDLGTVYFYPAGLYSLFVKSGAIQVDHISKSAPVRMTINPQTFNPETGQYVVAGDVLKVWYFDEEGKRWKEKSQAVVEQVGGKLTLQFDQTQTGTWMAGWPVSVCNKGATLVIQSNIPSGACTRNFFTRLIDVNTGKAISSKWSDNYLTLENQKRITLSNIPQGVVAKLQVWEGVRGCEGQLMGESQPFNGCSAGTVQIPLPALTTQDWMSLNVSLAGYCSVKGVEVKVKPQTTILYRPAGCGVYGLLGELPEGEACMGGLKKGQVYDFKTRFGDQVFEFMQIPMENGEIAYALPSGDRVRIRVATSAGSAQLIFEELPLPDDICNLLEN